MHTAWRLERTYLAGAGRDESRLEGLDIGWADPFDASGHAALWADNGTGKTMITALRYALYLPHSRDFIRGDSDRSLAKLVRSRDVCHVVEQVSRVVDGELQRVVVGMVAEWPDGGTRDLDNPGRLHRHFYGWQCGVAGPTIDDLPFRTQAGRWATRPQFISGVREILPRSGAGAPYAPSDHQGSWQRWLANAGIDLEQVRFQTIMNASEGGVDRVMRFADSDAFVRWLTGATMSSSTVDQITKSIETLRANASARPHWVTELDLWEKLAGPILDLAVAYDRVGASRRALATAEADAVRVLTVGDATIRALAAESETANRLQGEYDKKRRDAGAALRRAQAHRLRMELRAFELTAADARNIAEQRARDRDEAVRVLNAWRLVGDVLDFTVNQGVLAGLEERRDAAEKQTEELRQDEELHRRELARLLTSRRDRAGRASEEAARLFEAAAAVLRDAEQDLRAYVRDHAAQAQHVGQLRSTIETSELVLNQAVLDGLLGEGEDPAQRAEQAAESEHRAQLDRDAADRTLTEADRSIRKTEKVLSGAQRRADTARDDAEKAERALLAIESRIRALTTDVRFLDVVGSGVDDPWEARASIVESLAEYARVYEEDAATARQRRDVAQRTIHSVGSDGLLPPPQLAEDVVALLTEQPDSILAWPGWCWLADTMTAEEATAFALARPEIVSGVVVARPDLLDRAAELAANVDRDVAVWIGAVVDPAAARARTLADDGAHGRVLLPPPGTYDRDAASKMVDKAADALAEANAEIDLATRRASNARDMAASFASLWTDFPTDPRRGLADKAHAAHERRAAAQTDLQAAEDELEVLAAQREEAQQQRIDAQTAIDDLRDTRLLLMPVVEAARAGSQARQDLPAHLEKELTLRQRVAELDTQIPELREKARDMEQTAKDATRQHADMVEALRAAGLAPNSEGPIPTAGEAALRARLASVEAALASAAVDPELHQTIHRTRSKLADLEARLSRDPALRALAEQLAETDGARHPVALTESVATAETHEGVARERYSKAQAHADTAHTNYQSRAAEVADRTSPDVEGFPPANAITEAREAERVAFRLDAKAAELSEAHREAEANLDDAKNALQRAEEATKLVERAVKPLRRLAAPIKDGRPAADVDQLIDQLDEANERIHTTRHDLDADEGNQNRAANAVRAQANSPQARLVEGRTDQDPRLVDLIHRLRGDEQLPADAMRIADELEQRIATLRDDLADHDKHVRTTAKMLHVQAATALQRLRAYQNQSSLPEGLGEWSQRKFVTIDHEPVPDDESVAVDRVARVVHSLLAPGTGRSDAQEMLFAAARALVDAPFQVRILKPHTNLAVDRVDVAELKNFSGGQRVTAGVLLYAAMTRVRASGEPSSIGWLWLDNPFGQASADQFVRTMRLAADKLGLQLVFTAAPKDKGALSMFDRVVMLARKSRPSSKERVVVVDNGGREVVDLTLVQKDALAVLGE
ncbi:chromosome segregation ATPase [Lentzea atacamensis]|uniref:Chromosome segregation ATPase n=1 Tax=Lentzea atacamensis TaxID=531938 RepID=A0ABX9E9C7_9PSEU|nr:hypothetical protein [Lentzea atacamensis]RAS64781.1 chromosome segregation ATPase [Lentzea atacamensis]